MDYEFIFSISVSVCVCLRRGMRELCVWGADQMWRSTTEPDSLHRHKTSEEKHTGCTQTATESSTDADLPPWLNRQKCLTSLRDENVKKGGDDVWRWLERSVMKKRCLKAFERGDKGKWDWWAEHACECMNVRSWKCQKMRWNNKNKS